MGTKVTDELLSTVRSIVGADFSDMDIIRALHLANHDPNAAINIIFDTPNFKNPDPRPIARMPRRPVVDKVTVIENHNVSGRDADVVEVLSENGNSGGEWWFVGWADVAGMSTSKGRKLRRGDEVIFTFPKSCQLSSRFPSKGFGRARQAVVACSEIVRFSTKSGGEVLQCFVVIHLFWLFE